MSPLAAYAAKRALKYLKRQRKDLMLFFRLAFAAKLVYDPASLSIPKSVEESLDLVELGIEFCMEHGTPNEVRVVKFLRAKGELPADGWTEGYAAEQVILALTKDGAAIDKILEG